MHYLLHSLVAITLSTHLILYTVAELLVVDQLSVASVDVIALEVAGGLPLVRDAASGGQQDGVLARVLNNLGTGLEEQLGHIG